jgi:hypothetical protein
MAGGGTVSDVAPGWYQVVGITLAFLAGFFEGSSLVLQKRGILNTKKIALETGNNHAYLKSPVWWMGMVSST